MPTAASLAIQKLAKQLRHGDESDEQEAPCSPEEKYIMKAIENPNNDVIAQYTSGDLEAIKAQILGDVCFEEREYRAALLQRLRGYRYVDELSELREGVWTRWVPLDRDDGRGGGARLTAGGLLCEVRISDRGAVLVCKNGRGRFFQFHMEASLVFQKLTDQEKVILCAVDALA